MKKTLSLKCLLTLTLSFLLTACGGGGGGGNDTSTFTSQGTVSVSLTDSPACGFDEVNVTITKVRVHQTGSADENSGGWSDITLAAPQKVNLLDLVNGNLLALGSTTLVAGQYNQLRLVLQPNTVASPLANSVVPTGGVETALTTPSGVQNGLKINEAFSIGANQTTALTLDFDACKSIVTSGAGNYLLKPVLSVIPMTGTGGITGLIDTAIMADKPVITAQLNGVVVKSTVPNATTREFTLSPLGSSASKGNYDVVITANGRVTAIITGVPVTAGTNAVVSNATTGGITLASSTTNTVSGVVTPAATEATIRAIQNLTPTGPAAVTVQSTRNDLSTGAYSMTLPIEAPVLGAFSAGTLPIVFNQVLAAKGIYTIEGSATGFAAQSRSGVNINILGQTENFTF